MSVPNWVGPWSINVVYNAGDVVSFQGSSYISNFDSNAGQVPGQSNQWSLFAAAGRNGINTWRGVWQSQTVYDAFDAVSYNNASYVSLVNINQGNIPSPLSTQWAVLASAGAPGPAGEFVFAGIWSSSATYIQNDIVSYLGSSYAATGTPIMGVNPATDVINWALIASVGARGATGPQGPQGVMGLGFAWRGAWSASAPYYVNDVVGLLGNSYVAVVANTGVNPSTDTGTHWQIMASGSATLAGDADVSVVSPIDADTLMYATSDQKWHNRAVFNQVTKRLYVDGNRMDSYTANGTVTFPFKTIMAAVSQIISNGDNGSVGYLIDIAPGIYPETIALNSSLLYNIAFDGHGTANGTGVTVITGGILSNANNTQLNSVIFNGITFSPGTIHLVGDVNGTNFASNGVEFDNCVITCAALSGFIVTNLIELYFFHCDITAQAILTNMTQMVMIGRTVVNEFGSTNPWQFITTGGNAPAGFSGTTALIYGDAYFNPIVIGTGSTVYARMGTTLGETVTVNGSLQVRNACLTNTITINSGGSMINQLSNIVGSIIVNSGGTYTEEGGWHSNVIVNPGGTFNQTGEIGTGSLMLGGGVRVSTGSGAPAITGNPGDVYLNTAPAGSPPPYTLYVYTASGWTGVV